MCVVPCEARLIPWAQYPHFVKPPGPTCLFAFLAPTPFLGIELIRALCMVGSCSVPTFYFLF